MLCSDMPDFRQICVEYCKIALQSTNEIVLLLPYYESVVDVWENLTNNIIGVEKYKKEGSLILVESTKGYFSLKNDFVGIIIMIKMLLERKNKLGKSGVSAISDMGLFFHNKRISDLIQHEIAVLPSIHNMRTKIFCNYRISDFELLSAEQKQQILDSHTKTIQL